ncbi:hypothetical protein C8T65DRAFT_833358 [Cerioporus squamosus]|nr:hypothetical protein C8T65DRAFT_833358 [Cerioporus squamosus]
MSISRGSQYEERRSWWFEERACRHSCDLPPASKLRLVRRKLRQLVDGSSQDIGEDDHQRQPGRRQQFLVPRLSKVQTSSDVRNLSPAGRVVDREPQATADGNTSRKRQRCGEAQSRLLRRSPDIWPPCNKLRATSGQVRDGSLMIRGPRGGAEARPRLADSLSRTPSSSRCNPADCFSGGASYGEPLLKRRAGGGREDAFGRAREAL